MAIANGNTIKLLTILVSVLLFVGGAVLAFAFQGAIDETRDDVKVLECYAGTIAERVAKCEANHENVADRLARIEDKLDQLLEARP